MRGPSSTHRAPLENFSPAASHWHSLDRDPSRNKSWTLPFWLTGFSLTRCQGGTASGGGLATEAPSVVATLVLRAFAAPARCHLPDLTPSTLGYQHDGIQNRLLRMPFVTHLLFRLSVSGMKVAVPIKNLFRNCWSDSRVAEEPFPRTAAECRVGLWVRSPPPPSLKFAALAKP